jgi:hypothetical protein
MEEIIYIIQHVTTNNPALPDSKQELINNLSLLTLLPATTIFILYAIYEEYFNC